jgi:hypothetical protein
MKPSIAVACCLLLAPAALRAGQRSCEFDIVGTWESTVPQQASVTRHRFTADGKVTTLSRVAAGGAADWRAGESTFEYRLDDPRAPKLVELLGEGGVVRGSLEILKFDDASFTTAEPDGEPTRWVRVDPQRYFAVLVAARGNPGSGGPAFAMLVKADKASPRQEVASAFGFHFDGGRPKVGPIPADLRDRHLREPATEAETMLRVELTPAEFDGALRVLQGWERRAREGTLLYDVPYLTTIVFMEEAVKSLNRCREKLKLYELTWAVDDKIVAKRNLPQVPFYYIKELRLLNEALHVKDPEFERRASVP